MWIKKFMHLQKLLIMKFQNNKALTSSTTEEKLDYLFFNSVNQKIK